MAGEKKKTGAPAGTQFQATVDGELLTFDVMSNVFSDKTMDALSRLLKRKRATERTELLRSLGPDLDPTVKEIMAREVVSSAVESAVVGYEEAVSIIQTGDGLATVLQVCSPQCKGNFKFARKVVAEHENLLELSNLVIGAGNEALEAAGNLPTQKPTKKEEPA